MNSAITQAALALVKDQDPAEMTSWLWDVQNNLTLSGYVGDLTPAGREEFLGRITALREFFNQLAGSAKPQ
jgi:hypothetical protein